MRFGHRHEEHSSYFGAVGKPQPATRWDGSAEERVPYADVTLHRGGYKPNFRDTPTEAGGSRVIPTGDSAFPYEAGQYGPVQGKLFTATPSKISSAFSDPSLKGAVPILLGQAVNEAKRLGTGLMGDSSLSKHSSPLVKRGLKSGLLVPNPSNPGGRKTNDIQMSSRSWSQPAGTDETGALQAMGWQETSPEQVAAARTTVRGLLRSNKSAAAQPESKVLKSMPPKERRLHTWLNNNSANPDTPNTAGLNRAGELPLGHAYSPEAQANQNAWNQKHYGDPEPPVGHPEARRLEQEIDTERHLPHMTNYGTGKDLEPNRGSGLLTADEMSQRKARLATASPPEDPRSPSKAEWQDSAAKPGKGQRKLF